MSEIFFNELGIPNPKYNLGIGGGLHGAMTGAQLSGIETILLKEKPDWVMVYGDTNSTLAGALAAAKLHIPVAHVEAGLRSFNRQMPEEINRVVTDHLSTVLFAPTNFAMLQLSHEGIPPEHCHQIGDVMFDASLLFGNRAKETSTILHQMLVSPGKFILATIHRAENTDDSLRLQVILAALGKISQIYPVIWPVHPRVRKMLEKPEYLEMLGGKVRLIEPVGYLDMLMLEQSAALIATDSGGVQKEAFFCKVPCVTLRHETEWVELVKSGWNRLAPPKDTESVYNTMLNALNTHGEDIQIYGTGNSAKMIVQILRRLKLTG